MDIKVSEKEYKNIVKKVGVEKMKQIEASSTGSSIEKQESKAAIAVPASNIIGAEYLERSKKEGISVKDISMSVWERNNIGKSIVINEKDVPVVEENKERINELHETIQTYARMTLEKAIEVGELLFRQKELILYGGFGRWILENTPIKIRTAQNYMKLYYLRHLFEGKNLTTLTAAYAAINGEAAPDEVVDVDDSTDIQKESVVENSVTINEMKEPALPKKKAKGQMTEMVINQDLIQQLKSKDSIFSEEKEKYVKIVVPLPSKKYQDPELIGEFTCAAAALLKAGGKLIFHRKQ